MLNFIQSLPKAELHLHIEGTFEPELMFEIAKRNSISLKYNSIEEIKNAYQFQNLQEFLDIYYEGAQVLIHELDFFELTEAYLNRIHAENVQHVEIFFDPQTHTQRGVSFETVFNGIFNALQKANTEKGITFKIILCFLRHLSEDEAFETLKQALPYKEFIIGVGLDSSELGNPPSKFKNVFELAKKEGFLTVAHAGEEGPVDYIWEAIHELKVSRIDHGNQAINDEILIEYLISNKIPLTICPLSNLKLQVVTEFHKHPLKTMLEKGLCVTVNSDDPAYFGGYMNENFLKITEALQLSTSDLIQLVKNSFQASFLSDAEKLAYFEKIDKLIIK